MVATAVPRLYREGASLSPYLVSVCYLLAGYRCSWFFLLVVILIEIAVSEKRGRGRARSESLAKLIKYFISSSVQIGISTELCKQYIVIYCIAIAIFDDVSVVPQLVHEGRLFFRHIWSRCVGQTVTYIAYLDLLFVIFL